MSPRGEAMVSVPPAPPVAAAGSAPRLSATTPPTAQAAAAAALTPTTRPEGLLDWLIACPRTRRTRIVRTSSGSILRPTPRRPRGNVDALLLLPERAVKSRG